MNDQEKKMFHIGSIFQFTMFVSFLLMVFQTGAHPHLTDFFHNLVTQWWLWPSHIGWVVFGYCIYKLYIKHDLFRLQTGGLFRYTRHPMYTALLFMATQVWFEVPTYDWYFLLMQTIFVSSVIIAGYCQEKETLARFGKAAEDYYARTPRLFFMYPFYRVTESL